MDCARVQRLFPPGKQRVSKSSAYEAGRSICAGLRQDAFLFPQYAASTLPQAEGLSKCGDSMAVHSSCFGRHLARGSFVYLSE